MANATLKTYDPAQVAVVVGGNILTGFAEGTFVQIARNADMWALKIGADGSGTRCKTNNKSGRVTVTLQMSSPSVDSLSALENADEMSNSGVVPVLVRDASGRTVCSALSAWIVKPTDVEFGNEPGTRVFVMETNALEMFAGGNSP